MSENAFKEIKISNVLTALTISLLVALISQIVIGGYLGRSHVQSFLLYLPTDMPGDVGGWCRDHHWGVHFFGDFQSVYCKLIERNPYEGLSPAAYLPATYLILTPLKFFGRHYWLMFFTWTVSTVILLVTSVRNALRFSNNRGWLTALSLVFCCWPFWVALDRGNIQVFVVALTLFGLTAHSQHKYLGPALLGLASAFKGYPIIFSAIYLKSREWKQFVVCWVTFSGVNLAALAFLKGSPIDNIKIVFSQLISFSGNGKGNFDRFAEGYLSGNSSLSGLFHSMRQVSLWRWGDIGDFGLDNYQIIVITIMVLAGIAISCLKIRGSKLIYILTCLPLLLIGSTAAYSLLILLIPICMWTVDNTRTEKDLQGYILLAAASIIMAPISIPLNSANFDPQTGVAVFSSVSIGSIIRPILLLLIMLTIVIEELKTRRSTTPVIL